MLLAQYNLSRLIDRIEEAGYAERRARADDGRGQVIVITAAGGECAGACGASTDPQFNAPWASIARPRRLKPLKHCSAR